MIDRTSNRSLSPLTSKIVPEQEPHPAQGPSKLISLSSSNSISKSSSCELMVQLKRPHPNNKRTPAQARVSFHSDSRSISVSDSPNSKKTASFTLPAQLLVRFRSDVQHGPTVVLSVSERSLIRPNTQPGDMSGEFSLPYLLKPASSHRSVHSLPSLLESLEPTEQTPSQTTSINKTGEEMGYGDKPQTPDQVERVVNHLDRGEQMFFKVQWKKQTGHTLEWVSTDLLREQRHLVDQYFDARGHTPPHKRSLFRLTRENTGKCRLEYREFPMLPPDIVNKRNGEEYLEDIYPSEKQLPYFGQKFAEDTSWNTSSSSSQEGSDTKIPPSRFDNYRVAYSKKLPNISVTGNRQSPMPSNSLVLCSTELPPSQDESLLSHIQPEDTGEDGETSVTGGFFEGDTPQDILAHRMIPQPEQTDRYMQIELLVKWRKRADDTRPQPTWYTNTALAWICPEFLCNYLHQQYLIKNSHLKRKKFQHSTNHPRKLAARLSKTAIVPPQRPHTHNASPIRKTSKAVDEKNY